MKHHVGAATLILAVACVSAALVARHSRSSFSPEGRLLTSGRIFAIASADLDGDGRPDVVVSDFLDHARVLFNGARDPFTRGLTLTSTPETAIDGHGVAIADFDGDRALDLFLVYNGSPSRVMFGDGKGGFTDSGQAVGAAGLNGVSVEAADVDGDGDVDVFVSHYQQKDMPYLNDGKGRFTVGEQAFEGNCTLGDLDSDRDPDAACTPGGGKGPASIWLNTKGRFVQRDGTVAVGDDIAYVRLADLNGDAALDLVALNRTTSSTLWQNDGHASFRKLEQVLNAAVILTAGDIDLDGDADLVLGTMVWLNSGGGRFEKVQSLALGDLPTAQLLVDVDGDGDLDLLANRGDRAHGRTELLLFTNTRR